VKIAVACGLRSTDIPARSPRAGAQDTRLSLGCAISQLLVVMPVVDERRDTVEMIEERE
jgi:hypothetical protein